MFIVKHPLERKSVKDSLQVTYESVEDVHLTDPNSVYFNVGLESESETSEVLSLPGSSEEVAILGDQTILLNIIYFDFLVKHPTVTIDTFSFCVSEIMCFFAAFS